MSRMIRILLVAWAALTAACGEDEPTARGNPCLKMGPGAGGYQSDDTLLSESRKAEFAAECESVGCVGRDTALCLFHAERKKSYPAWSGDVYASLAKVQGALDGFFWRVWDESNSGPSAQSGFECYYNALDGERELCGIWTAVRP